MSVAVAALCRSSGVSLSHSGALTAAASGFSPASKFRLFQSSAAAAAAGPSPSLHPYGGGSGAGIAISPDQAATQAFLRSRWPYIAFLGLSACAALGYSALREPAVTQRAYLDFEVDGQPAGRVVVGLYGREAPLTCENFAALASHERGFGYRGCPVHRTMPGWSVWCGDVTRGDGSGGVSVYGPSFGVETMGVRHRRGSVSMVLDEQGRLRSQFFFTLVTTPGLDRKAAAFGRVLEGMEVLERLSRLPTRGGEASDGRPLLEVRVRDSGVLVAEQAAEGREAAVAARG